MYIFVNIHLYVYIYAYICVYIYICIYVFMYICIYICMHVYIHIHKHIHTYIFYFVFWSSFSPPWSVCCGGPPEGFERYASIFVFVLHHGVLNRSSPLSFFWFPAFWRLQSLFSTPTSPASTTFSSTTRCTLATLASDPNRIRSVIGIESESEFRRNRIRP